MEENVEYTVSVTKIVFLFAIISIVITIDITTAGAETISKNCYGCLNNTNTQVLTIFNFQTKDNPFLAGNAAFLIMPNPYSHTTNSTDYLDLNTWFNFVVSDNDQFDSDPTFGIIELKGVNNGTYSVWQIKGSPGFGMAPYPEASDDILGTTGFSYITQTFANFTATSMYTIEPPVINNTMLNKIKAGGAMINGISISSGGDLPSAMQIVKTQGLTASPPAPVLFTSNVVSNTSTNLLNNLGIPTYSAPKGFAIDDNTVFIPPVFVAPISGGGKFIIPPVIDEVNPGLNINIRMDNVEQGIAHHFIKAIELPMNTFGSNVGISIKVDTANPTGVAIPSGNVALFLEFQETGDVDFSDPSVFSENPTIHFNVEKDGTSCPTGVVLYLLESGHWHEVTPAPVRNPSGDTIHTCAYSSTVEHFSSYLVGSGSAGHSHGSTDHSTHTEGHASHSSHSGHSGHGGHAHGTGDEHEGHSGYHIITQQLNIFEIEYDITKAIAQIVVGTTGRADDLQVLIYSREGGIRSAHLAKDQPFLTGLFQQNMKKYVFEVPLHPKETFFRVAVDDKDYNLNQSVMIKGLTGKIIPWFANLSEGADHDIHDAHDSHTSTIRDTGFEIKFNGGTKVLTYNNIDFPIKYEMAGAITGLGVNEESKSVTLLLEYVTGGELTLRMPRTLIDAIDDNFVVFASASTQKQIDYDIISSTSDYYTLKMNLPENTRTLTIVGSKVVPEFGTLAILVLVSALFAVLIKTSNRFTGRFS